MYKNTKFKSQSSRGFWNIIFRKLVSDPIDELFRIRLFHGALVTKDSSPSAIQKLARVPIKTRGIFKTTGKKTE